MDYTQINYDAERPTSTLQIKDLFNDNFYTIYCRLRGADFFNPGNFFLHISQRGRAVNVYFTEIMSLFDMINVRRNSGVHNPGTIYSPSGGLALEMPDTTRLKLRTEELIYHMKLIIDLIIQCNNFLVLNGYVNQKRKLEIDSYGALKFQVDRGNLRAVELARIINGDGIDYTQDTTGFLEVLNDLFNSFKHCLLHQESSSIYGIEVPTVISYYLPRNDFSNPVQVHNHNIRHIFMGFQDTVDRIHENMIKYITTESSNIPS